jgi:hypothetical protein
MRRHLGTRRRLGMLGCVCHAPNTGLRNGKPFALKRAYPRNEERRSKMTLKIEKALGPSGITIRLIGRMQTEHLQELKSQIELSGPTITLDLEEMSLVDVEAVRFLAECQAHGVNIVNCSPYVRDWINSEADSG